MCFVTCDAAAGDLGHWRCGIRLLADSVKVSAALEALHALYCPTTSALTCVGSSRRLNEDSTSSFPGSPRSPAREASRWLRQSLGSDAPGARSPSVLSNAASDDPSSPGSVAGSEALPSRVLKHGSVRARRCLWGSHNESLGQSGRQAQRAAAHSDNQAVARLSCSSIRPGSW